ncbi:RNA polymerase epsilon subunit [Pseudogracilibacillus sp. SE30717A]|uniref:DNA-dependent RNA polymerase subunit epsilon n=1 Tax=Pseudogracilibacillus sp. SE30717A TaxID=3098293 RepID=UPI00300E3D95
MIFKVLYQDSDVALTREGTKSLYVEAESERDVRKKLSNRNINIEYIQQLKELHFEYEKKSEHFRIESV